MPESLERSHFKSNGREVCHFGSKIFYIYSSASAVLEEPSIAIGPTAYWVDSWLVGYLIWCVFEKHFVHSFEEVCGCWESHENERLVQDFAQLTSGSGADGC